LFVLGSVAPFEPSVLIVRCGVALDHCVGIAKDHLKPHDEVRAAPGIRLINQAIRRWRVNKHHGILSMLDGHRGLPNQIDGCDHWVVGRILRRRCDGDLLDR
jgi:hypothetical protein